MARWKSNLLVEGFSGGINKQLVFKQYGGKTIVSKYPDRSKVVLSEKQKSANERFSLAVEKAKALIADPEKKAALLATLPKGKSAYHAALAMYLKNSDLG